MFAYSNNHNSIFSQKQLCFSDYSWHPFSPLPLVLSYLLLCVTLAYLVPITHNKSLYFHFIPTVSQSKCPLICFEDIHGPFPETALLAKEKIRRERNSTKQNSLSIKSTNGFVCHLNICIWKNWRLLVWPLCYYSHTTFDCQTFCALNKHETTTCL